MTAYIDRLTEELIGSANLHLACRKIGFGNAEKRWEIAKHLTVSLATHGIHNFRAETLGRIIGDIEPCDIMCISSDLTKLSNCDVPICTVPIGTDNLRWATATLLAVIIRDRLDPEKPNENLKPSKFVI